METRKVALSLIDTLEAATTLETFLQRYEPGQPISLTEKEKQALLMLLAQIKEEASDFDI